MNELHARIRALAQERPEKPALIDCDEHGATLRSLSRKELLDALDARVREFDGRREPLLLEGASSSDFLVSAWAAWCAGVTLVPLDGKRDTAEMRDYKAQASKAAQGEALILFTSGTTAKPKGARLTLENLMVNAESIAHWLRIGENDRFLVQLPLHHINSTTFCLSALLAGASLALPEKYSNSKFWEVAARSGATLTSLVPSIIFDQLSRKAEFEAHRASLTLTRIQLGSAPVIPAAAQEFMDAFGIPLYQGYGQTETALRVTGMPLDLPQEQYRELVSRNSIGTPLQWAEVEIMADDGRILGEKEEGELVVKGLAVMKGYVAGEPAFRDGWFLTGDSGWWEKTGDRRFFFLKGRKKEIIIKGGVNISPAAVEDALLKVSGDIAQAYVVGVEDARYGEDVGAVIVWKPDLDAEVAMRTLKLRLLTGSPALSSYESPLALHTLPQDELPMTSTGKVQRMELKARKFPFEPVTGLFGTATHRFSIITPHSPLAEASRALHNHCWQPLTLEPGAYQAYLKKYWTLAAVRDDGRLDGQISFSVESDRLTCVSICSARFTPKPVPEVAESPAPELVREYVLSGKDPVMNFHASLGASLVEVIPNGRPEDRSALGYTMLLSYPPSDARTLPDGPVSQQLIAAARIIGRDLGLPVFALSRPGALAAHLAEKKKPSA